MSFDLKIENNDISINPDGSLKTVRNNEKLIQDIIKIMLTTQGSNKFYSWYGSTISSRIVGKVLKTRFMEVEIRRSIEESLNNLMALQNMQGKIQYASPGEVLSSIQEIIIERDELDNRILKISISCLTKKLTTVETTFELRT